MERPSLHQLVDSLIHRAGQAGQHTDDIALLLLLPNHTAEV
ncbi:hypothetical protein [Streptomyces actinomycinicus]|nr:hypothetical protein [Streptomyces actinomycinicus]